MASQTHHHWADAARGLAEMRRVSRRQVVFTWDQAVTAREFWFVRDYLEFQFLRRDPERGNWPLTCNSTTEPTSRVSARTAGLTAVQPSTIGASVSGGR